MKKTAYYRVNTSERSAPANRLVCPECGKVFLRALKSIKPGKTNYCSLECGANALNRDKDILNKPEDFYLRRIIKWKYPKGFRCPRCGSSRVAPLPSKGRTIYECICKFQSTYLKDTPFYYSQIPLSVWFRAMYRVKYIPGTKPRNFTELKAKSSQARVFNTIIEHPELLELV